MNFVRRMMILFIILIFSTIASAQNVCETLIQTALTDIADLCADMGANMACYDATNTSVSGRDGAILTNNVIDVADIQSLTTSALNNDTNTWGLAKINIQANLPDTGVTMVIFGDATLTNQTPLITNLPATVTTNGRMRSTPSSALDTNILVGVPQGSTVYVGGRNEVGDWLYINYTDYMTGALFTGWISNQVLQFDTDRMLLDVVDGTRLIYAPMQAFTLTTGDTSGCGDVPTSGLLIQTPEGDTRAELVVNGVKILLGSTAYLQTADNALMVNVIEGSAIVQAENYSQFAPAGTFVSVPLTDDSLATVDIPSEPMPYAEILANLSTFNLAETAQQPVFSAPLTIATPIPEDEIATVVQEQFAPYGALDGIYIFYYVSLSPVQIPQGPADLCGPNRVQQIGGRVGGVPPVFRFIFTEGNLNTLHSWFATAPNPNGFDFSEIEPGIYGVGDGAHRVVSPPSSSTGLGGTGVESFYIESPTSIRWRATIGISDGRTYSAVCETISRGIWQSPLP